MWYRRLAHSRLFQVSALAFLFAGIYPLLRSLPNAECAFLHYDYVGEAAGGAEYCGTNEAAYLNLERLKFPVEVSLDAVDVPRPGERCEFNISFTTSRGDLLKPWELAVVHTEKIHLLLVDPSLEDYHHVHPEPIGMSGQYRFAMTPQRSGSYKLFAEIVPLVSRSVVVGKATFDVTGSAGSPKPGDNYRSEVEGFSFVLVPGGGRLLLGVNNLLHLKVMLPVADQLVQLEKVMGTYAHMVAFDENRNGFAHMHPLDEGTGLGTAESSFGFSLNTDTAGYYKVWAQIRSGGRDIFAPFDVIIDR
jgi:hypothetical protein